MQTPRQENVVPLAMPLRRNAPVMLPTLQSSGSTPSVVPFPRWQKACDRVSAALLGGDTLVLVTGPAGTGKTLLLDNVSRVLRAAGWTVVHRLADAAPPPTQPGNVALLIDEADRLSREALKHLLATTSGPLVLAGLDGLQSRVPGATQIVLSPLGQEEARDYIAHWLALTGRTPSALDTAAMRRTIEISGGIPRLASTLLGAAAWLAESSEKAVITVQHVEEAAALRSCFSAGDSDEAELDRSPQEIPEPTNTPFLAAIAASMLLLGAGAYFATRYYPAETEQAMGTIRAGAARLQALLDEKLDGKQPTMAAAVAPPPPAADPAPIREVAATPAEPPPSKSAELTRTGKAG